MDEYERLHRALRESNDPASVLVTDSGDVVDAGKDAAPFLREPDDPSERSLIRLVRPELRLETQNALLQARHGDKAEAGTPLPLVDGDHVETVRVVARAVGDDLFLVVFERVEPQRTSAESRSGGDATETLAAELERTRQQLRVALQDIEASSADLRAENEALRSLNAVLRSTAETQEHRDIAQRFEALVHASSQIVWTSNAEMANAEPSPSWRAFTGQSDEDFLASKWADVIHPDDMAYLADVGARAGAVHAPYECEFRLWHADSQAWRTVHVHAAPIRGRDGSFRGYIGMNADVTEAREQEERLMRAAERNRALVAASSQITWTRGADGRIVEDSPSWRAFTGQTVDEWMGDEWSKVIHPDDVDAMHAKWMGMMAQQITFEYEYRVWSVQHGGYRKLLGRAVPVTTPEGTFDGYVGMIADVTQQRDHETSLAASAQRGAFRAELADALRGELSPSNTKQAASRVVGQFLGACRVHYAEVYDDQVRALVESEYIDGVPSIEGVHRMDDHGPAIFDEVRAGRTVSVEDVATEASINDEQRATSLGLPTRAYVIIPLHKAGRTRAIFVVHYMEPHVWEQAEIALIEEAAERTWSAVERAKIESDLRRSEEQFRQAAAVADIGTWHFDEATQTFDVLARARNILGMSEEHVPTAKSLLERLPLEDQEGFREARAKARDPDGDGLFEFSHRLRMPDGSERWIDQRAQIFFDLDEKGVRAPVNAIGVCADVTVSKLAEQSIREDNKILEERVAGRTAQVRSLAARLAAAEQDERQRIAQVLHDDLQQQLYGLGVAIGILRDANDDPETSELLHQSDGILRSATELTRSLAVELSPTVLSGSSAANLIRWLSDRSQTTYGLLVEHDVADDLEIEQNHARILLYQTLRELLFNVVKHAGTNECHLRVWLEGGCVAASVRDDGAGFDVSTNGHAGSALSLGLPNVRERIELVGGTFEIQSQKGMGTTATVRIPLSADPPPAR